MGNSLTGNDFFKRFGHLFGVRAQSEPAPEPATAPAQPQQGDIVYLKSGLCGRLSGDGTLVPVVSMREQRNEAVLGGGNGNAGSRDRSPTCVGFDRMLIRQSGSLRDIGLLRVIGSLRSDLRRAF
jgi:hypothetical protein